MSWPTPPEHRLPGGGRWWGPVPHARPTPDCRWLPDDRLLLAIGRWGVLVTFPGRKHEAATVAELGAALGELARQRLELAASRPEQLAIADEYRPLLLVLAWAAAGHLAISVASLDVLTDLADADAEWLRAQWRAGATELADTRPRPPVSPAIVRAAVEETIAHFPEYLYQPTDPWTEACWLIGLGRRLWEVRGETARRWACWRLELPESEAVAEATVDERARRLGATFTGWIRGLMPVLIALVALWPQIGFLRGRAPVAFDGLSSALSVWVSWLALAAGPGDPPPGLCPSGIGSTTYNPSARFDTIAYVTAHDRLARTAAELLRTATRPLPRYLDRLLAVELPLELVAGLAGVGLRRLRVQPVARGTQRGLWVAAEAEERTYQVWWPASPDAVAWVPWLTPVGVWPWLHACCAALWHDLCTDAVVLPRAAEAAGQRPAGAPPPTGRPARSRVVRLPGRRTAGGAAPITATPAVWGETAERRAIAHATAVGHGYRRLPAGWEERQGRPDFQQRQAGARFRAAEFLYPEPPVGFTFVRPYTRLVHDPAVVGADPVRVRSQGLLALTLAAQDLRAGDLGEEP